MMTSEDVKRVIRGPADLEERIEQLEKQKELLKTACKKAGARIKELDNSLVVALDINDKYQRDNKKLKERVQEAEGEMTIVKGIGMSSPEMREAKARIEELEEKLVKALAGDHRVAESDKIIMKKMEEIEQLKADLTRAKKDHQYDNLVHQKELEDLGKK